MNLTIFIKPAYLNAIRNCLSLATLFFATQTFATSTDLSDVVGIAAFPKVDHLSPSDQKLEILKWVNTAAKQTAALIELKQRILSQTATDQDLAKLNTILAQLLECERCIDNQTINDTKDHSGKALFSNLTNSVTFGLLYTVFSFISTRGEPNFDFKVNRTLAFILMSTLVGQTIYDITNPKEKNTSFYLEDLFYNELAKYLNEVPTKNRGLWLQSVGTLKAQIPAAYFEEQRKSQILWINLNEMLDLFENRLCEMREYTHLDNLRKLRDTNANDAPGTQNLTELLSLLKESESLMEKFPELRTLSIASMPQLYGNLENADPVSGRKSCLNIFSRI